MIRDVVPHIVFRAFVAKNSRVLCKESADAFLDRVNPSFLCFLFVQIHAILSYYENGMKDTAAAGSVNSIQNLKRMLSICSQIFGTNRD